MSCKTIVQVSFPHKCGQLSWCNVLNAKVMATFPRYFLSSSHAHLWSLLKCLTFWCRWPTEAFLRCIHSSDGWSVCFSSLDFCSHVKSESAWSSCLPSSGLVHVLGLDWCMDGPFPILGMGLWALHCVQIPPSHSLLVGQEKKRKKKERKKEKEWDSVNRR